MPFIETPPLRSLSRALHSALQMAAPIMESRVTIEASLSSVQPSVPFGLSGRTKYRSSLFEIPDPDFDLLGDMKPEFGEHTARLDHDPAAVRRRLVPVRRKPEDMPGVAGAQGTYDDVVDGRRVLENDRRRALDHCHMWVMGPAEFTDRVRRVGQEPFLVAGVGPRPGHNPGADLRAEPMLEHIDDLVDGARRQETLLQQQLFDGLDPKSGRRRWFGVIPTTRVNSITCAKPSRSGPSIEITPFKIKRCPAPPVRAPALGGRRAGGRRMTWSRRGPCVR